MKPQASPAENRAGDLFRVELRALVDPAHALVKLADTVAWPRLEEAFGALFCDDNGRPALATRLLIALHYLKYAYDLSDEDVVAGWVENPYWLLGRTLRDIARQAPAPDAELQTLMETSQKIFAQRRHDKGKIYSVHAPHTACIAKGKAHKRYEFGSKVALAATSRGGWFVAARAVHGNPYGGHTLAETLQQVERVAQRAPQQVHVDRGFRGHDYSGPIEVHEDRQRRGAIPKALWRWMKRRAAIEPGIGHLKQEHRMDRNRLAGQLGDTLNALFSAAGMNFRKLAAHLAAVCALLLALVRCLLHQSQPPQPAAPA